MFEKMLLKLRDFVWDIRKHVDKDWAEMRRTHFFCGYMSLNQFFGTKLREDTFEGKVATLECLVMTTPLRTEDGTYCSPEMNCVLQYEEEDQLFSAHYYLNDKYQLHIRFFDERNASAWFREDNFISIYAHKEIRPDYDPVAHIKGKEISEGCTLWRTIKSTLTN